MRLSFTAAVLGMAALAAASASNEGPGSGSGGVRLVGKFPKRQNNILDNIQSNVSQAWGDVQDFFGIGHANDDSAADSQAANEDSPATKADDSSTPATTHSRSSATPTTADDGGNDDSETSTRHAATTDDAAASDSGKDSSDSSEKTTKSTATTSKTSATPTPTGESCSTDNEKRCPAGSALVATYQQCIDGVWTDQSCDKDNVCGKNNDGDIACVSKEQATTVLDPCSTKDDVRCDSTDPAKYQTCDGKYWQDGSCGGSNVCKIVNNDAVCINSADATKSGADVSDYTLIEPSAFVPESAAKSLLATRATTVASVSVSAALAFALAAASWGF
ncbi:hypothetical protein LPJ72_004023 [Coemansia sp. Benny D160-2]|nr:hypothetical protein LPJ72_004023 [Coemansia sp. Benny D160-2]